MHKRLSLFKTRSVRTTSSSQAQWLMYACGRVRARYRLAASSSFRRTALLTRLLSSRLSTPRPRSEEHTSELQSLMRISYAVFCLKKQTISLLCTWTHYPLFDDRTHDCIT